VPQFFINSTAIRDDLCRIDGEEFHHMARVRRVHPGETVLLVDENRIRYTCSVESADNGCIVARVISRESAWHDFPDLTLCCSLLKGGHFDLVIQKAVELGVRRIFPVISERTISHPEGKEGKHDRWERIAKEAAKQCMRAEIPVIEPIVRITELLNMQPDAVRIMGHPEGEDSFRDILKGKKGLPVLLLVGPEGGFSAAERDMARSTGWHLCRFGITHLRAETAAIALSAIVFYELIEETC